MNKNLNGLSKLEDFKDPKNIKKILIVPQNNGFFDDKCIEITVEEDVRLTIQTIMQHGGLWTKLPESEKLIFLPWPFAAILEL